MSATQLLTIDQYIAYFSGVQLPVLRRTVRDLAALREDEENVSGRRIAGVVLQDPLMTLRVLVHIEANRRRSQNHDITTIERAIMMIGVTPFFEKFLDLPTVEEHLAAHPKGLLNVLRVIARARNAAQWARDWAIVRHDVDVDEVTVAALLHEAAEILLGCFRPAHMQKITQTQQENPGLRSAVAQQMVLGVTVNEVQKALVRAWRLPELLITLMDADQARNARVRNVILACNLARHAANGWDDPALPDDYAAIAKLLRLNLPTTLTRIGVPQESWPDLDTLQTMLASQESLF